MQSIRPAAMAGHFYPSEPHELRRTVARYLDACAPSLGFLPGHALIAPHAGYVYSGAVAAQAYAAIAPFAKQLRRIVLIGPAHRIHVRGIALSSADAFSTPLGNVPLSAGERTRLLVQAAISINDEAHEFEHSLEVHLPFLQTVCGDFELIPMVVGDPSPREVQKALEPFWDDPHTLIVVSTDLSHFHDYATAKRLDAITAERIVELDYRSIHSENACGSRAVNGLLRMLQEKSQRLRVLSTTNSGDSAGSKDRVVGYGAFIVEG